MSTLLAAIGYLALFAFFVGMIRPQLVVRWGHRSRKDVLTVYLTLFIASAVGAKLLAGSAVDTGREYLAQLQKEAVEAQRERGETVGPQATNFTTVKTSGSPSVKPIDPSNTKQQWGITNINIGSNIRLDELIEALGDFEQIDVTGHNPAIIKAYYFRDADMTVFLNTGLNAVSHWRIGRASE